MLERKSLLPLSVAVYVTNHCQHSCGHCFLARSKQLNYNHMRYEDLMSFLDLASKNGVFLVVIAGGDPFLHPRIECILRQINNLKMRPLIGGNPSEAFEYHIPLLSELKVPTVQFSLDSHLRSVHDEVRQPGSFDRTLSLIKVLHSSGINVNLSVCITRKNSKHVLDIIRLAADLGIYRLKLVFWQSDGLSGSEKFVLEESERMQILGTIKGMSISGSSLDWISVPGYSLESCRRVLYKYPNLAIHADGVATIDETGIAVGNFNGEDLSHSYYDYVVTSKSEKIRSIFNKCIDDLGISVERMHTDGLNSAGKLVRINGRYVIIINSRLSALFAEIIAMHELGHIATETIGFCVNELSDLDYVSNERIANQWVLDRLGPFLPRSTDKFADLDFSSDLFYQTLLSEIERGFYIF